MISHNNHIYAHELIQYILYIHISTYTKICTQEKDSNYSTNMSICPVFRSYVTSGEHSLYILVIFILSCPTVALVYVR